MSLLRSESMGYFSIAIPRENAWDIMNELGELSTVQFVDLHEKEQILARPYTLYIKRLEEMEQKITTMEAIMSKFNMKPDRCTDHKAFLKSHREHLGRRKESENTYINDMEAEIDLKLKALNDQIKYFDASVENHNLIVEYVRVLEEAQIYFNEDENEMYPEVKPGEEYKLTTAQGGVGSIIRSIKVQYLAGVIDREDVQRFRRVLFRATLGMVWSDIIDIEPRPASKKRFQHDFIANSKNEMRKKTIFLIAYPAGDEGFLKAKLGKIADSFNAHKYGIPMDKQEFLKKLEELKNRREDEARVLQVSREHLDMLMDDLVNPDRFNGMWARLEEYRLFVRKEKALYHNLGMLREREKFLEGYFWCPLENEETVRKALENLPNVKPNLAMPKMAYEEKPPTALPPTSFRTNDFTAPFQAIVNTYGVPRYQEVNPGLFTVATFPFLFGVMFGDIGHGLILFVFGLYLCFAKDSIKKEKGHPLSPLLYARYLFAMMGFWALYCGFIYNDFMALPLNIFGSCYTESTDGATYTRNSDTCIYPFGLDPAWYKSTNELTFFNSFKMKMAIIIGVAQMTLGVFLKALNAMHFRSWLDFCFEWIPQIIFLMCTFGYMVALIFIKWATPYGVTIATSEAPAIINIFINFVLKFGQFDVGSGTTAVVPLFGSADGSTETTVQQVLLILALISVPWMLIPKPVVLILTHLKKKEPIQTGYLVQDDEKKYDAVRAEEDKKVLKEKAGGPLKDEIDQTSEETSLLKASIKDETRDESKIIEMEKDMKAKAEDKEKSKDDKKEKKRKGSLDSDDEEEEIVDKEKDADAKEPPKKDEAPKKKPATEAHREEGPKEEGPGDILVHQLIETIEFVLGSVSHTASYLRLWALSLAHSQLAAVFFTYTMGTAISSGNFVLTFFGYPLFALITFGVLLCMDLLECFLHALRLHWVEFQSKFYKADGKDFEPFSYETAMDGDRKL